MGKTYFKAPPYFVQAMEEIEQLQAEMCAIMGISINWFNNASDRELRVEGEKLTKEERSYIIEIIGKMSTIKTYAWARIRYDNLDTEMPHLQYNEEKQTIHIKQNPIKKLLSKLEGII